MSSAADLSLDECDICGGDHYTEQCPELGVDENSFQVSTRARSTLPNNLEAQSLENGMINVIATAAIPAKTRFGPLDAQRIHDDKDIPNGFVLKLVGRGPVMTFDSSNEDQCNWMVLVRTADSEFTQNLMAFQVGHDIYFSALQDIGVGEELRVWYAPHYAKKLSKPVKPDPNIQTLLYMQGEWQEALADQTITIYITEDDANQITAQQQQHTVEVAEERDFIDDNDVDFEPEDERRPSKASVLKLKKEPFFGPPPNRPLQALSCRRCSKEFYDKAELALHIQEHLKVNSCEICEMSFFQLDALKRHMAMFHRNPMTGDSSTSKIKKEKASDYGDEHETAGGRASKKRRVSPPPRNHRYSTRGIRLDMAKLTGIKREPQSSDEEYVPEKREPKKSPTVKRGRGRPRKVVTPAAEVKIRKPRAFEETNVDADVLTSIAGANVEECQESVKRVVDAVVNAVELSTNVAGEADGLRDENINDDDFDDRAERVDDEARPDDVDVEGDEDDEAEEGEDESGIAVPEMNDEELASYEREEDGLVLDREQLKIESNDREKCYIVYTFMARVDDLEQQPTQSGIEQTQSSTLGQTDESGIGQMESGLEQMECSLEQTQTDIGQTESNLEQMETNIGQTESSLEQIESGLEQIESVLQPTASSVVERIEPGAQIYECRACGRLFSRDVFAEKHVSVTHGFVCSYCTKSFRKDTTYQVHRCKQMVEGVKPDADGVYHCPECDKKFATVDTLHPHLFGHRRKLQCRLCKRSFMRKETYRKHACPAKRPAAKTYRCDICNMTFATAKYLFRHLAAHTERFKCIKCSHSFSRKQSLLSHINKCNPAQFRAMGISAFPCRICNRVFSEAVKLDNHMVMHEGKYKCDVCFKSFTNMNTLKLHICSSSKTEDKSLVIDAVVTPTAELPIVKCDGGYACRLCDKHFATERLHEKHMTAHTEKLVCDFCDTAFQRRLELNSHVVVCRATGALKETGRVSCEVCPLVFIDLAEYKRHVDVAHTQPFRCDTCERHFRSLLRKIEHERVCLKMTNDQLENLVCQSCGKIFKDAQSLARHMIVHQRPQHHCDDCGKDFYRRDYFNQHTCRRADGTVVQLQRGKYDGAEQNTTPHICHLCGNSYISYGNLNKHLIRHGEKTVPCPVCEKMFHLESAMKEHLKHVHSNDKCAQCPHCGKMMKSKNSLGAHIKQFHRDNVVLYPCQHCGKAFRQRGNMLKHMLMHSSHKTYACPYCDKSFKYPEQLHKHKLEHEQGRQFNCADCNRWFVKEYELRKHNAVFHSGVMYTCEFCPTDCRHIHTLKRHIRRRHPDRLYLLNDASYLRSLQRIVSEGAVAAAAEDDDNDDVENIVAKQPKQTIQTIRILQPGSGSDRLQEMEIELTGIDQPPQQQHVEPMQEVTIEEIQNDADLQQVQRLVGEASVAREGNEAAQTVSIEFMSHEAAEVLQSLSTTSGDVQTVTLADLTRLTAGQEGATHIIHQDGESQEYILVPLINATDEQHAITTG